MPFYYDFDDDLSVEDRGRKADIVSRTASNLLELRARLDDEIPPRTLYETLLVATWNIRWLGKTERTDESLWYIAEILSRFDLTAIQEVKRDLRHLEQIRDLLGPWWRYIVTDASEGSGGNDERLAFLFDTRKVRFGGMVGELVLPPIRGKGGKAVNPAQIVRTPFVAGFKSGWFDFMISTVHILFGDDVRDHPERVYEIRQLARFLAKRQKDTTAWSRNLILLGDFNIFDTEGRALRALTDAGFEIPEEIRQLPVTNVGKEPRKYDQIAFLLENQRYLESPKRAGVFDFFATIYSDAKLSSYRSELRTSQGAVPSNKSSYYRHHWRRFQMSDHLPMWVELPIEFADPYLRSMAGRRRPAGAGRKQRV